jgi:hypothetical protein
MHSRNRPRLRAPLPIRFERSRSLVPSRQNSNRTSAQSRNRSPKRPSVRGRISPSKLAQAQARSRPPRSRARPKPTISARRTARSPTLACRARTTPLWWLRRPRRTGSIRTPRAPVAKRARSGLPSRSARAEALRRRLSSDRQASPNSTRGARNPPFDFSSATPGGSFSASATIRFHFEVKRGSAIVSNRREDSRCQRVSESDRS